MENPEVNVPKMGLLAFLRKLPSMNRNLILFFKEILDQNDGLIKLPNKLTLTDDAELIQYFLQKNNSNYIKTSLVRTFVRDQIGDGLFTSDGKYWLKQRRAIQAGFHKKKLVGISKIMLDEINQYMDNILDVYAETNQEIDLEKEMTYLASKVVSKSLFGQEFDNEKIDVIDDSIAKANEYIVAVAKQPFLKPWYHLNGAYKHIVKQKNIRDKFILDFIEERKKSGESKDDLLGMLLDTEYEDGSKMTNKQLLDESIILIVAGNKTSAVTMAWLFYLLAKHPGIEEKVLQSVTEILGDEEPSIESIRSLTYPLQVLEETMRMYPVVWLIDREPVEDDEFSGIKIKKGEDIAAFVYGLHHNPKYWKDPECFDPERFTPENKKEQVPFSYLPFGGGPRICIGKNFAIMEMQFILAMFIRRYKFVLSPGQNIGFKPLLTLSPTNGIKVRVQKRNPAS
ncbi:cytochrome P450 [Aureispira sp. CCB-E]|uniref:cytochrome P450 n=1 Tax=Aureispira sp. CCB-E TaxID=3051121 RepID=UPI0028689B1E|nr:cytochrome P450 [Aureispira sp. CCB-E]WMX12890.1 cytochrome P450 [Aureispira sp. CCB-E]